MAEMQTQVMPDDPIKRKLALQQPQQAPQQPMAPVQNPYNTFRQNLQGRQQAALQQNIGGIQRRFAQMGGGPSGAQLKMEQQVQQQNAQDTAEGIGQINAQEAQQVNASNESQRAFDREAPMKQAIFDLERESKLRSLDIAERQATTDEQGQLFNQALAAVASKDANIDRLRLEMSNFVNYADQQMRRRGSGEAFQYRAPNYQMTPDEARAAELRRQQEEASSRISPSSTPSYGVDIQR